MLQILCPDECLASVYDIDLAALRRKGIRALILDLDNTLVSWDRQEVSDELKNWIQKAKSLGFSACIASNGLTERVMSLAQELQVPAIPKAVKPRKRPFRRALALLGATPEEAAVVGDQIFTDILGGNRMDLYTILINPLSQRELRTTRMVRRVERRILDRFSRRGMVPAASVQARKASSRPQKKPSDQVPPASL